MRSIRAHHAPAYGFTLVELMVTLMVAVVLAMVAIPSYRTMTLNARRDSVVDALVASLHYARNQALNQDRNTTVCAGTPGATCAGGSWATGWEVLQAPSGSTSVVLTTHVLQASPSTPALTAAQGSIGFQFSGNGLVSFQPALPAGTELMKVCDSRGAAAARAVEINRAGYIQSSSTPGTAPDGSALSCP